MSGRVAHKKAVEREKEIKQYLKAGLTCAQVAEKLGVTKQRIYNFMQQAKRRRPHRNRLAKIRMQLQEDRELASKRPVLVDPSTPINVLDILTELKDLLSRSEFWSRSIASGDTELYLIGIDKTHQRIRRMKGAEELISKLRTSFLPSIRSTLIRRREYSQSGAVSRQTWAFNFSKF